MSRPGDSCNTISMKRLMTYLFVGILGLFLCQCQKKSTGHSISESGTETIALAAPTAALPNSNLDTAPSHLVQTENANTVDRGNRPPRIKPVEEALVAPVFSPPTAGAMVDISGGTFLRGSASDDELREQFAENDHLPTKMTPFQMDVLPWPNDPAMPFTTNVTRHEAMQHCESAGKRLCTELELEWACKSEDNRRYISGNSYNPAAYSDTLGAPSPFGVWGLGKILEWTASPWGQEPDQLVRASVRGFAPNQEFLGKVVDEPHGTRCAKRWRMAPDDHLEILGFRCCSGQLNNAQCFIERPRPAHSTYKTIKPDEFAKIIRSIPQLAAVHDNPHMFSNADVRAVLAKRGSDRKELARSGIHFGWKPIRWIPRQGMELWLAVGRSNRHSFVVALHETKDNGTYVHESSMIVWDNPIALALVYREGHRDEVYWAPCWRCRDGGGFEYDEKNNQVIITSRW